MFLCSEPVRMSGKIRQAVRLLSYGGAFRAPSHRDEARNASRLGSSRPAIRYSIVNDKIGVVKVILLNA
jgi:hypothetical protein